MAGYIKDPRTRLGLIALLAARRSRAERLRRETAAQSKAPPAPKTRKTGWFG